MLLAAISFSDPLMLVGLLAAAVPVILHLLNRIRSPIVPFPTLRFLKITAQKTSRRRQIQNFFLLLLRMLVFALIAMAVARPLIRGGNPALAYTFVALGLAALFLLTLAAVFGTAAIDTAKLRPASALDPQRDKTPQAVPSAGRYWAFSLITLLVAVALLGYASFGLASDRYFAGDRGTFTGSSTAMVIVFDNSHSMLARQDSASRLDRAKETLRQLLVEKIRPAEAAILPTNPGTTPAREALTADTTALLGYVDKLGTAGRARPMKERIARGLQILQNSTQTNRMLVVVSDFARNAFADADVLASVKGVKDLQVVLMPMTKGSAPADVGVVSFNVASGQPVVGNEITFEAQVLNSGDAADVKDLAFYVDDQPLNDIAPRVQLGPAGSGSARTSVKIAHRLAAPGYHRYAIKLKSTQDAADFNNSRQLVLNVAEQVKVLVIGPEEKPRQRSAAFFFNAALAPFDGLPATSDGKAQVWSIKPTYRGVADAEKFPSLAGYSAVFMCDVPRVPKALAETLSRYVASGGRIVWVLGASVDANDYNDVVGRDRGLLPGLLTRPLVTASGSTLDWADLSSDIFTNLFDNQEPFRGVVVTGRWSLAGKDGAPDRGRVLAKLADGAPLVTQHATGSGGGEIYTLLSSPSANWSNLASTVVFLPMASRMALGDSGRIKSDTAYEPGQPVLLSPPITDSAITLDVTTPAKAVLNVAAVKSGELPRWYFDRTLDEGLYTWVASDRKSAGQFWVNPPADEVDLVSADAAALGREARTDRDVFVAHSAEELVTLLAKQAEGTSLAPGVLAMVLMLVVVEALLANRHRPALAAAPATEATTLRRAA